MLAFAFEPGMGFERYVDYALDVPLYFVKRGDHYQDVAGASFRDLLAGRLRQAPGERATIADWANHLSSIFPEVRLKRYLEMRGPDVGPPERIVALSALMAGLYYDPDALRSAEALIEGWSAEDRQKLRDDAPLLGLGAEARGRDLRSVATDMLAIARGGLKRRRRLNARGEDETILLRPLEAIAASGREPARHWIERYEGPWGRSVDPGLRRGGVLGCAARELSDFESARLVAGGGREKDAVEARRRRADERRARRPDRANEFRRIELAERGGAAADRVVGAEPRASRDVAADAPAVGRTLADARPRAVAAAGRRVGGRGGKDRAVEFAGARQLGRAADEKG